jgi:5-oxoprolinase (ATP-hydrolysing) subunit A
MILVMAVDILIHVMAIFLERNQRMHHPTIDLNCDLGEGMTTDAAIIPFISSANIACGYHAGDDKIMKQTVATCVMHGVAIGAHPGFADRAHFGRREVILESDQAYYDLVIGQLEIMQKVSLAAGTKMRHVKPHGALYNMSASMPWLAAIIAKAVHDFDASLVLFGLAGSHSVSEAETIGLKVVHEFFADRTYQPDGTLTPRSQANALITDEALAVQQALSIAGKHQVQAVDGTIVNPIQQDGNVSICLHGDGDHAAAYAQLISQSLKTAGFSIAAA